MENRRELSLRLDEVMDMVGASESMRQLHRRAAMTKEILRTVGAELLHRGVISYHCGSSYEGTVTPDTVSDVDTISAFIDPSVVTHRLIAGPGKRLVMCRDDCTYPGYVKLQVLQDGWPLTIEKCRVEEGWGFDRRGRLCLKPFSVGNMHGPASMLINEDGQHLLDHVPALKCDGIPPFAAEWSRRQRSHGWPSEEQLGQMRVMGCMVVGVGFYNSLEKDIEWRLSFSLQERFLIRSLNIYQHKTYILLKLIKTNILENEFHEESLSSFHCKTCVLYMAELTPARMWTRDNLIDCLLECLKLLLKWLRDRFCPSYFIKEQNLFEKEGFESLIEPLERSVDLILQSGHQFLYMLQSDNIGELFRSGDFRLYRQVSDVKVNECIYGITFNVIDAITGAYFASLVAASRHQDVLSFLTSQLESQSQSQDRVSGNTPEETEAVLRHLTPWLHLLIGLEFACRAVTWSSSSNGKVLIKKVDSHFHKARNTDLAKVRLAQASILFRFEKFEECFLLLHEMEAMWSVRVINFCNCKCGRTRGPVAQTLYDCYPPMRDMSVTKLLRNYVATCAIFLPSQIELVPPPLQYEMFRSLGTPPGSRDKHDAWFDWAVVDANVYLHFMQYLVCSRLDREPHKQIAIDNLASLIHDAPEHDLHHKETAYNLLGWIYLQEHRTVDAVWCFLQSWQIRPHHNAAKFHVLNVYQAGYTCRNTAL